MDLDHPASRSALVPFSGVRSRSGWKCGLSMAGADIPSPVWSVAEPGAGSGAITVTVAVARTVAVANSRSHSRRRGRSRGRTVIVAGARPSRSRSRRQSHSSRKSLLPFRHFRNCIARGIGDRDDFDHLEQHDLGDWRWEFAVCGLLGPSFASCDRLAAPSQYQILLAFVSVAVCPSSAVSVPAKLLPISFSPCSIYQAFSCSYLVEWLRRYLPAFAVLSSVSVTPAVRRWSRLPASGSRLQSPFLSFFISPRNAPAIGLAGKSLVTGLPCAAQGAALLPAGSAHALNHDDAHGPSHQNRLLSRKRNALDKPAESRCWLAHCAVEGPWTAMHWESMY